MHVFIKIIKWASVLIILLVALIVGAGLLPPGPLPERHGQVSSELFVGPNSHQPLIVGLGGSEGGNPWAGSHWQAQREKFIAQGYAFLAIGYFATKESPAQLDRIALEGVHRAVMAAIQDPHIDKQRIVLLGGSKGAELALTLASYYKDYTGVIAIVPGSAVFPALTFSMNSSSFSYQDKELNFVPVPWSATPALLKRELRTAFAKMMENTEAMADAAIKVEDIQGPILFLSATRDEMWPSTEMSEMMMQRLKDKQFRYATQHIAIEGGHTEPLKHFATIEAFLASQVRGE
ncbi:MAG TPA: acyl-CoA thioester hydrolase/BAAT C-terminal domain-containing protein [Cellvibrio sp.]|nr:acyl-CoA thioester hydrolase/BAAT C-terminal domain-containing protein [Cellvibrio sp.]